MYLSLIRVALALAACLLVVPAPARAQILISDFTTYTEDFQTNNNYNPNNPFTGTGFTPTPPAGRLDSRNWIVRGFSDGSLNFGGTNTTGDFARGNSAGGVTTGGIHAFNIGGGNIALGVQPAGNGSDFTNSTTAGFFVKIQNQTGAAIPGFTTSYERLIFNDQGWSSQFNFGFAVSDQNLDNPTTLTYTSINDFTSPATADTPAAWVSAVISDTRSVTVNNGEYIYFRWQGGDVTGSGSRDEFAIGSFSFTAVNPVPEPGALLLAALAAAGLLRRRLGPPS